MNIVPNEPQTIPYPSALDLQTLAEDKEYASEISTHTPTVFFRPEDRTREQYPGYWRADSQGNSFIRFVVTYGDHTKNQRPVFLDTVFRVTVISRIAKKISEITEEEYREAYRELATSCEVQDYLALKYPNMLFSEDSLVTVYTIAYI